MSCYEIITTVISILSLLATTFFAYQVYKLSKQANKLSKEANNISSEQLKLQKQQIDESGEAIKEKYSDKNIENVDEFNKVNKELQKKSCTYKNGLDKLEADNFKKWKERNNRLKKEFLNQKK